MKHASGLEYEVSVSIRFHLHCQHSSYPLVIYCNYWYFLFM